MTLQLIKDVEGFKKDTSTNAVLSINNDALLAYKKNRKSREALVNDINNIKQELSELKNIIHQFISSQMGN